MFKAESCGSLEKFFAKIGVMNPRNRGSMLANKRTILVSGCVFFRVGRYRRNVISKSVPILKTVFLFASWNTLRVLIICLPGTMKIISFARIR